MQDLFPSNTVYEPLCKLSYNNKGDIKNAHIYIHCIIPQENDYSTQISKWKRFVKDQQTDVQKRFISIKPNWMFDKRTWK